MSIIDQAKKDVTELFLQLCGDPDDRTLAAAADRALRRLDELLGESESAAGRRSEANPSRADEGG